MFQTSQSRWIAVQSRSKAADGLFLYAVKTTKIYCRTSCKARLARRSNVDFFDTVQEAREAGFRPCKRCRPDLATYDPESDLVKKVSTILDNMPAAVPSPSLEDLAKRVGLTKFHFHRTFKRMVGMTPKAYVVAKRHPHSLNAMPATKGSSTTATRSGSPSRYAGSAFEEKAAEASTPDDVPSADAGDGPQIHDTELNPVSVGIGFKDFMVIAYDTVLTTVGLLLVVFKKGEILKVQLENDDADVETRLTQHYPLTHYAILHISQLCSPDTSLLSSYTEAIAEAIERPDGKLLNLPFAQPLEKMLDDEIG
ncbi:MAG: hypothetical protein Q9162_006656 [Coniocarpon cinnabarinum]